jgi:hypothetical protein
MRAPPEYIDRPEFGSLLAPYHVQAVMIFPDAPANRRHLLKTALARRIRDIVEQAPNRLLPAGLVQFAFSSDHWKDTIGDVRPASWSPAKSGSQSHVFGGSLAGRMLILAYVISERYNRKIGIGNI